MTTSLYRFPLLLILIKLLSIVTVGETEMTMRDVSPLGTEQD